MGRPHFFNSLPARKGGPGDAREKSLRGKADAALAMKQWQNLADEFIRRGYDVLAIRGEKKLPQLAMAGSSVTVPDASHRRCVADKIALLPSLGGKRAEIEAIFASTIRGLGFHVASLEQRFAGGVDLLRCEKGFIFTPRSPQAGPGKKSLTGMLGLGGDEEGSDPAAREYLREFLGDHELITLPIIDPRFAQGDHICCPIGEKGSALMIYVDALAPDARQMVLARAGRVSNYIIPVKEPDAAKFVTSAVQVRERDGRRSLIMPAGASDELLRRIEAVGVTPVPVDLSEWIKKDRGGVRSMVAPLGWMTDDRRTQTPEIIDFRRSIRVTRGA